MLFRVTNHDRTLEEEVEINTLEELRQFQIDNNYCDLIIDFDVRGVAFGPIIQLYDGSVEL